MSESAQVTGESKATSIEVNGINVIAEEERKGRPRDLFMPWFAANISVLAIPYGVWFLGFGISFWQATIAGVIGVIASFLLVGFSSLAGKVGSAPTMILSRAAFGVRGNAVPSVIGYLILVGWEIVLVTLATLATNTVLGRLGWATGNLSLIISFLVIAAIIMAAGILGFDAIMKVQTWITWATAVLTVIYIALTVSHIDLAAVMAIEGGSFQAVLGALVLAMTGFGLSWANSASDYSRYLPRSASSRGVVGWTTFGASVAPIVLVIYGLLLAGSDPALSEAVNTDPIGALTAILPLWFLIPFAIVAILGLVGGAVFDIYSSGLTLLALGLPVKRWQAAALDGVLMIVGTVYAVWVASNFIGPFQGFLITLGVPLAVWVGIFLADLMLRRQGYHDTALFDATGPYGSVNWASITLMVVGSVVGWGLVTNTMADFTLWQGYLLGPLGGKEGAWAYANLGVLVAILIGFLGYWALCGRRVRDQA